MEGEYNLTKKSIYLCSEELATGIDLFSKVVTNDFSDVPDGEIVEYESDGSHSTEDDDDDGADDDNFESMEE